MNDLPKSALSPLAIAMRLRSAALFEAPALAAQLREQPGLVPLIWFLQDKSRQPGGLDKFALDLVDQFAPCFGPAIVHDEDASLLLAQREQIWAKVSGEVERELLPFKTWATEMNSDEWRDREANMIGSNPVPTSTDERKRFREALMKIPPARFRDAFLDAAKEFLPGYLRSFCLGVSKADRLGQPDEIYLTPWYCENIVGVLSDAMDAHAASIRLQLAPTQVVSQVFDALDYCWSQKTPVRICGKSRTGKTEAVVAWCAMHPGRVRRVVTPPGRDKRGLIVNIADALGLHYKPDATTAELTDAVRPILHYSSLMLVIDEAHNLVPINPDRAAQPVRLEWVRGYLIDMGIPVALITTPQFKTSLLKFKARTDWADEQFEGRFGPDITLPDDLGDADLLAVVKHHGAGVPKSMHGHIIGWSKQHVGYLHTIREICCFARYTAQQDGGRAITEDDVKFAASQCAPGVVITGISEPPGVKRSRPIHAPPTIARPALQALSRQASPPVAALEIPAREPALTTDH